MLLIAKAVSIDPSAEAMRQFLSTVKNFNGAMGRFSASGDNRFTLGAAVKEVKDSNFVKLR